MPFRGVVNMYNVSSVIRAVQAEPGLSVAIRSASTLRATEPARRSSCRCPQISQGRHRSQSGGDGAAAKQSTHCKTHDVKGQPKDESDEDMISILPVTRSLTLDTHELFVMRGKVDLGAAGPSLLLHARD